MFGHLYRYPHPLDDTKFLYCGQGSKRDDRHRSGRTSFGRRFKKQFPGVELPQPIRETVEVSDQLELNELETVWMFQFHTWRGYEGGMNLTLPGSDDYRNMGRIGGRISGSIVSDKKTKASQRNVKAAQKASRSSAKAKERIRLQGRKNVANGHLAEIASIGGSAALENKAGIFALTHQQLSDNSRKGGKQALKNKTGIFAPDNFGIGGRKAVALKRGVHGWSRKRMSDKGKRSMHNRWHLRRDIIKFGCAYCVVIPTEKLEQPLLLAA